MKETIDPTRTGERVPRGRSRSLEPRETAYTAPAPRTVEEVSEYLFQLHPPLIYDHHRFSSGSRRSSPAAKSRAGSRGAISKPSSRATSRATTPVPPTRASAASALHLECSMPQPTQCHSEYSASPITGGPSPSVKRPFGQVYDEPSRPQPSPLHPPFVLSYDYGSSDNAPLRSPAIPSGVTVVESKDTEVDSGDDDEYNENDYRDLSGRLNFRRSGSNERYSAQTKMGRIYRKVRLRRSKCQMRARQRLASNPERSLSGDGCLVPTHTEQRPPRYTRKGSPDEESAMQSKPPSGSRPKIAKTYHTPSAIAEGDMAWSPNNSPT